MVQPSLSLLAAVAKRAAPRLRKAPIVLTDAAAERIKTLLEKRNKVPPQHFMINSSLVQDFEGLL
jgi:hypothetical protein